MVRLLLHILQHTSNNTYTESSELTAKHNGGGKYTAVDLDPNLPLRLTSNYLSNNTFKESPSPYDRTA